MYKDVEKFPNFVELEKKILLFWQKHEIFEKLREKNQSKPSWSFLDGPITANNPMGVHHAWGRSLKDMFQRYHAMCGKKLRYQNGFDCQGLWVEVEVEKELGFKTKKDIESYGVAKFVEACKQRVTKFSKVQTDQSIRLGYWMDWNNSYYTMSEKNNYTIWQFLKKCHDRGYIYKDFDSMPWCPRCGVGLSQMEMHEGYKWMQHLSVVVRFALRHRTNEALLVWTTTPWTLTSNVAAAVNPDMSYLKVKQGNWTYYLGEENWNNDRRIEMDEESSQGKRRKTYRLKSLPEHLKAYVKEDVEIVGRVAGKELVGLEYDGPFDELMAQNEPGGYPNPDVKLRNKNGTSCHRIIAWEEVTGSEGTGIVHIAPGCGKEDFELGKKYNLVSLSPLDEGGVFLPKFGWLEGMHAHDVAPKIRDNLKEKGILIAEESYPHRYAHCWRCATPVLYRMVDEWYISMEWRDEIIKTVSKIRWIPEYGEQLELDWLRNMGDWMISKKRYWGLALPIWQCDRSDHPDPQSRCNWFTVIGSREELNQKAVSGLDQLEGHTPHRPWIDAVKIRCEACGQTASRISDVGNPWLDAGIVPYSTMGYDDPNTWKEWFPPNLVLECFPGQFRNWFYAVLAMNAMMQQDVWADRTAGRSEVLPPFRTLLGHALVRDEEGKEMHKSLGNAISFEAAADSIGAEVMRYIYACQNPTMNLNFPDISEKRKQNKVHLDQEAYRKLLTLWNCYSFYITYASVDKITPDQLNVAIERRSDLDRWILSKFQHLVKKARKSFENYQIHTFMEPFERFLDDLSNWYIRRSRRRFWKSENDTEKMAAFATLYEILEGTCRLMAPIMPFLSEEIYQNLVLSVAKNNPLSVHLLAFPEADDTKINSQLETQIDTVVRYKNLGLSLRNRENIKVRQPLGKILIKPQSDDESAALQIEALQNQVLEELNIKSMQLITSTSGLVETSVRPNFKSLGAKHGPVLKEIQKKIEEADPQQILGAIRNDGTYPVRLPDQTIELSKDDLDIQHKGTNGLSVLIDGEAFVALDTTITPELRDESIARDFVRAVQIQRKEMNLHVADRIKLRFRTDTKETCRAILTWSDYIRKETLALELLEDNGLDIHVNKPHKIGGHRVYTAIQSSSK